MEKKGAVILVSKCLRGAKCRHNSQIINDDFVERLGRHVVFVEVCPEVEIGLGVPREPIRIVEINGRQMLRNDESGEDLGNKMTRFSKDFIDGVGVIHGAILKGRSPSCGVYSAKIHRSLEKESGHYNGAGFFAREVLDKLKGIPIEEEGRLKNFSIRENFLIRIFTLFEFDKVKNIRALKKFHERNGMLFMAYSKKILDELEKLIDNKRSLKFKELRLEYRKLLCSLLARNPDYKSWVRVIKFALKRIERKLSKSEKSFFMENIKEYEAEKIPLSVLIKLISVEAIRFKDDYLLNQSFIEPFDLDLLEISDSGKGREY